MFRRDLFFFVRILTKETGRYDKWKDPLTTRIFRSLIFARNASGTPSIVRNVGPYTTEQPSFSDAQPVVNLFAIKRETPCIQCYKF